MTKKYCPPPSAKSAPLLEKQRGGGLDPTLAKKCVVAVRISCISFLFFIYIALK